MANLSLYKVIRIMSIIYIIGLIGEAVLIIKNTEDIIDLVPGYE